MGRHSSEEFAQVIEAAVIAATDTFADGVETTQRGILRSVLALVGEMGTDNAGNFKQTAKNLRKLDRIRDQLRGVVITDAYRKRVRRFLDQIPALAGMNDDYLTTLLAGAFAPSEALRKSLIDLAIADTEASLIGAGLDTALVDPIRELLRQNVTSGGSAFELGEQLRLTLLGSKQPERLGLLARYSGQITRDSLNQFSRNYQIAFAEPAGLRWFHYSAGTVDDSREFCVDRQDRYYHIEEVRAWGSIPQWQGRIPGTNSTNIFFYLGGFNCMHGLNAVSEAIVPQSDKDRAAAAGYK